MDVESSIAPAGCSSVEPQTGKIDLLEFAASLLPWEQFTTSVHLFPGSYALAPWGTKGDFFISFSIYDAGKKIGEIHSERCNQDGSISVDFDDFLRNFPTEGNGLILAHYHHAHDIPVELYLSHIHKSTGTYLTYPSAGYMGDKLYQEGHIEQMENTMFWPGLVVEPNLTSSLLILNPFKVSFSYQVTLFKPGGEQVQSAVLKLKPRKSTEHKIEDLFPFVKNIQVEDQGQYSLCVAAQYKVVAYHVIRHNESQAITAFDHLHPYCLV